MRSSIGAGTCRRLAAARVSAGRVLIALILLGTLLWAPPCAADDPPRSEVALYGLAMEAHERGDVEACAALFQEALDMGSNHPALLEGLAGAYALLGKKELATALLGKLARMGVSTEPDTEDWFASLKDDRVFLAISARLAANAEPIAGSRVEHVLPERRLIPEGLARDPRDDALYLSSLTGPRIVKVSGAGELSVFHAAGEDSLWRGLGLKVHAPTERLWICRESREETRRCALFAYDLATGHETRRVPLEADGGKHLLNDLVLTRAGDIYVTDSDGNALYHLPAAGERLEQVDLGLSVRYLNGIALSEDESLLFVAHSMGILRVELPGGRATKLWAIPDNCLVGIDGLYIVDRSLLAVQNGLWPRRIIRFDLDPDRIGVIGSRILERAHPLFKQIPTTGAIAGERFLYIANSQMRLMDEDCRIPDPTLLRDVEILSVEY